MYVILHYGRPDGFCVFIGVTFSIGPFSDGLAQDWKKKHAKQTEEIGAEIDISEQPDFSSDKHFAGDINPEDIFSEMRSEISKQSL